VSFDFEEVTKFTEPLETKTLEAAVDFSLKTPMPLKIYKGTSVMNLVKTTGVGGESDTAHTWSNLVTTTEQPAIQTLGACCSGGVAPDVSFVNADGSDYSGTFPSCGSGTLNANYFVTTLQAPPTYIEITVSDPFSITTIVAFVGGWVGIMELVAFFVIKFTSSTPCKSSKSSAGSAPSKAGDVELQVTDEYLIKERVNSRKKAAAGGELGGSL